MTDNTGNQQEQVSELVAHLFRHQSGQLIASLTRLFGLQHLELVEDVVQEAMLKALKSWPFSGIPASPPAWLAKAARNGAIDRLRRQNLFRKKQSEIIAELDSLPSRWSNETISYDHELIDDVLGMLFACSHPELSRQAQVTLMLNLVCGFTGAEIESAFLESKATIAQRISRAKRKLRESGWRPEIPSPEELSTKLFPVLEGIYFLFNEGYHAHRGESVLRRDLIEEARRLVNLLAEHKLTGKPEVHALKALIFLQSSRIEARELDGALVTLEFQDRTSWDKKLIAEGLAALEKSMAGESLSEFHLQAGIAAEHSVAATWDETNWERIIFFYDQLHTVNPSPVVALNRAVAIAMGRSIEAGMAEVDSLADLPKIGQYAPFHATRGDLLRRSGRGEEAIRHYEKAAELAGSEMERRFFEERINECRKM